MVLHADQGGGKIAFDLLVAVRSPACIAKSGSKCSKRSQHRPPPGLLQSLQSRLHASDVRGCATPIQSGQVAEGRHRGRSVALALCAPVVNGRHKGRSRKFDFMKEKID